MDCADPLYRASDDFEVSIFLTETSTRHSLLYKHKHFRDTTQTKLTSNSTKLTGASREAPVDIDDSVLPVAAAGEGAEGASAAAIPPAPVLREEDDDDEVMALADIPSVDELETSKDARVSKRRRGRGGSDAVQGTAGGENVPTYVPGSDEEDIADDDSGLFVDQNEDDGSSGDDTVPPPAKRRKDEASAVGAEHEEVRDDKKKLAMDISYEGFAIYGRVLCLVVKRREGVGSMSKGKSVAAAPAGRGSKVGSQQGAAPGGQAVMENWITSTQMPADVV